ncbi:MAG: hypothetical protein LBS96_07165, partial [Oscillospiraceae bacterium]|nr:hypothetical protein [Oscillospiraceae bacterium]
LAGGLLVDLSLGWFLSFGLLCLADGVLGCLPLSKSREPLRKFFLHLLSLESSRGIYQDRPRHNHATFPFVRFFNRY